MNWTQYLTAWWIDFFAAATVLLVVVLLAGRLIRQPVQRMAMAWSAMIALAVLTICCAAPTWPRVALVAKREPASPMAMPPASTAIPHPISIDPQPTPQFLPLPSFANRTNPSPPVDASAAGSEIKQNIPPAVATVEISTAAAAEPFDYSPLLAAALLSGSFAVSCWLILGQLRARSLCRRATPAPEFAQQELRSLVGPHSRLPKLLVDKFLSTAAAMGLWQPTILLPAGTLEDAPQCTPHAPREASFSRSEKSTMLPLRALLAHEYAHIHRRDLWLLALGRLLLVVLFAHPLYWLLRRRIRTDQELLADALAAQNCGRHEYAETLVAWARHQPHPSSRMNWALGIWERPSQLSRRIAMLLNERISFRPTCSRRWQLAIFCATIATAVGLSAFTLNPSSRATANPVADEQDSQQANQSKPKKDQTELQWARGVADDFIAAWIGGDNAQAEMLVTEELKQRYEKYPQCPKLASVLLEPSMAGLKNAAIHNEEISSSKDEASFAGAMTGERNRKPIDAKFSLRLVKESGKWRISFFQQQQWQWTEQEAALPKQREYSIRKQVPILGPITSGGPVTALDPPSDDEVMQALEKARPTEGDQPAQHEVIRNNVRIVKEKIADYVDDVQSYPLIGQAQLHHAHYKCTVYFTKVTRGGSPSPDTKLDEATEEVVYIDHNHFHMVGDSTASDAKAADSAKAVIKRRLIDDATGKLMDSPSTMKLVAFWSDTVLNQPDRPGMRGFGGRLLFYANDPNTPVPVKGTLTVYAFDEDNRDPKNVAPDKKFVFLPDQLQKTGTMSAVGYSYNVWIPWDDVDGPQKNISLVARFVADDGGITVSESAKHRLPGIASRQTSPRSQVWTIVEDEPKDAAMSGDSTANDAKTADSKATIKGRLIDDATGKPIGPSTRENNLAVIYADEEGRIRNDGLAENIDADGRFTLTAPAGKGMLVLQPPNADGFIVNGARSNSKPLDLQAGQTLELELRVARAAINPTAAIAAPDAKQKQKTPPQNVTISGAVLDENHKPIPNAKVWLFRIDHGGKNYLKPNGRMKWVKTSLPGQEANQESPLGYSGSLGSPELQRLLEEVRTDEHGKYEFAKVEADEKWDSSQATMLVVVQAAGKGTEFDQPRISVNSDGKQWVEPAKIQLEPAQALRGRITNADGQPVPGALVSASNVNRLPKLIPGITCATTDADGRYEINDLNLFDVDDYPPQVMEFGAIKMATVAASVDHPDYAQGVIEYTRVPSEIDHVLQRPAKLSGKVVLAESGQATEKTYVRWTHENGLSAGDFTDAEGRYSFEKLLPGKYTLAAERNDRLVNSQKLTLSPGDNSLEFKLQMGGVVKGRVVDDATGKLPRFNRSMSIQIAAMNVARVKDGTEGKDGKEGEPLCQAHVQEDGTFSMAVHPGQNLLVFFNPYWQIADPERWTKQGIDITAGKTVELELRLKPRAGGWNAMLNEVGAIVAEIKGEPAPTPLPPSPVVDADLGDGSEDAMMKAFVDWPAELLPKQPMSEKALRTMLDQPNFGVGDLEKKTINGEEQITSILLGACGPAFDTQAVGQLIWLEHSLLAHIDKFPHLESLMMMGAVGDDDWLKPLRGNKSLKMVGFPYAKQITAAGIEHLSTLPNLEGMCLVSMRLDVDALAKIDQFPKLTSLQLGGNISDELLAHLHGNTKLKQLAVMVLSKTKLTDEGLSHLASMPNLEEFAIQVEELAIQVERAEPNFTDEGLKHFAATKKLRSLAISGKQITDAGLVHLYELSDLKELNVEGTSVTQPGLDKLQQRLPNLKIKAQAKPPEPPPQTATKPDSVLTPVYRPGTIQ